MSATDLAHDDDQHDHGLGGGGGGGVKRVNKKGKWHSMMPILTLSNWNLDKDDLLCFTT